MPMIAVDPPVKTRTASGYTATISEIDPSSRHEGVFGSVYVPGAGEVECGWNDGGQLCSVKGTLPHDGRIDVRDPSVLAVLVQLRSARMQLS